MRRLASKLEWKYKGRTIIRLAAPFLSKRGEPFLQAEGSSTSKPRMHSNGCSSEVMPVIGSSGEHYQQNRLVVVNEAQYCTGFVNVGCPNVARDDVA